MKEVRYSVHEHFYSVQGEGAHMGRAAYFIRLHGCDQKCSFCDSAGTWHPRWVPKDVLRVNATDAAALIEAPEKAFVVITGGEPALYELGPLVAAIRARGYRVHLETAGHRPIRAEFDWITLSPKLFATPPRLASWTRADEIKLIVTSPGQLKLDLKTILQQPKKAGCPIWLHPEWSQRDNPGVLRAIVETVKANPRTRAGYQLHKLFFADCNDENARKEIIPLGGR